MGKTVPPQEFVTIWTSSDGKLQVKFNPLMNELRVLHTESGGMTADLLISSDVVVNPK